MAFLLQLQSAFGIFPYRFPASRLSVRVKAFLLLLFIANY
jgi:hypothetical protein